MFESNIIVTIIMLNLLCIMNIIWGFSNAKIYTDKWTPFEMRLFLEFSLLSSCHVSGLISELNYRLLWTKPHLATLLPTAFSPSVKCNKKSNWDVDSEIFHSFNLTVNFVAPLTLVQLIIVITLKKNLSWQPRKHLRGSIS